MIKGEKTNMKKSIALLLALCLAMSLGCAFAEENAGLRDARSYINLMYKNKPASTPKDYELIGSVPGDNEIYTVEWTTDSDTIAVTRLENGMVKIDVDENNPKELNYKLTATVKDAAGNESSISFDRFVPAAINLDVMTEEEIVDFAYTLEDGAALPVITALTGTIIAIPTPYSEQYDNITVNIQVGDLADKPIQCYRLVGGSALQVGDEITVAGIIKNYKGTIEFDKGCFTMDPAYAQSVRVAAFAYTLEDGAAFSHESTVSGVITGIPSAYSADYGNITVNIGVPGLMDTHPIQCYRLTGGEDLAEGDVITVTGTIKNYKGTIEFDKGCTYVKGIPGAAEEEAASAAEELSAVLSGEAEDGDFQSILNDLLGLLGTEENGASGSEDIMGGLSGLFGELTGEGGEGGDLMNGLSDLFGSFGEETGEGGFLGGLSDLFGGLGEETGEGGGFLSGLSDLFGSLTEGGERSGEGQEMTEEEWNELLNTIMGMFSGE